MLRPPPTRGRTLQKTLMFPCRTGEVDTLSPQPRDQIDLMTLVTHLQLLNGVVQPPPLHLSGVDVVLLLSYCVFETADLLLCVPERRLHPGQSGLLDREFHLQPRQTTCVTS